MLNLINFYIYFAKTFGCIKVSVSYNCIGKTDCLPLDKTKAFLLRTLKK